MISISIVSHGQGAMINKVLDDLAKLSQSHHIEVILTINIKEHWPLYEASFPFKVRKIFNSKPKGFGENHNSAFKFASGEFFCVMNPDIRLSEDPFPNLIAASKMTGAGVISPRVYSPDGVLEDSARHFPTIFGLLSKLIGVSNGQYNLDANTSDQKVDWVAGMFMFFRSDVYKLIHGFDERYYLYYEDVDICARLWLAGYSVVVNQKSSVIHEAQRASRRNLRYMKWHIASMLKFLLRYSGRLHSVREINS